MLSSDWLNSNLDKILRKSSLMSLVAYLIKGKKLFFYWKFKKRVHKASLVRFSIVSYKNRWMVGPKPSLKIRTASTIFWIYLGIFRDYGLNNIFFRNKTFFFQDRKLKISELVWKSFNSIRQHIEKKWKYQLSE